MLLVSADSISMAHGTGAALLRFFAGYDTTKLANVFLNDLAGCAIRQHVKAEPMVPGWRSYSVKAATRVLKLFKRDVSRWVPFACQPVRPVLEKMGFEPDLIYGNCLGFNDLSLLLQLAMEYNGQVPVIQHFQDYFTEPHREFYNVMAEMLPYCDAVWTLTESIAADIESRFEASAEVMHVFKSEVPPDFKAIHRQMDSSFRVVLVGNFGSHFVLHDVKRIWRMTEQRMPGLRPFQWIAHPASAGRIANAGVEIGPEIEFAGFKAPGRELHETLMQADAAIIPLNSESEPQTDYERFSIPSRITEMALAGLPIFCLAGPATETRRYVEKNGIGVCVNGSEGDQLFLKFWDLLSQHELRAKLGLQARRFAEVEFDLKEFQPRFLSMLTETAERKSCGRSVARGWKNAIYRAWKSGQIELGSDRFIARATKCEVSNR